MFLFKALYKLPLSLVRMLNTYYTTYYYYALQSVVCSGTTTTARSTALRTTDCSMILRSALEIEVRHFALQFIVG